MSQTIKYPTPINAENKKEVTPEQEAKKTNLTSSKQVVHVKKSKSSSSAVSEQWHRYFHVYPHQAARIRMQQNIKEGIAFAKESVSYRMPMPVLRIERLLNNDEFPVCPRCNILLEREYMLYCNCCGQCLDWSMLDQARIDSPRSRK